MKIINFGKYLPIFLNILVQKVRKLLASLHIQSLLFVTCSVEINETDLTFIWVPKFGISFNFLYMFSPFFLSSLLT